MIYFIKYSEGVAEDLAELRPFDRKQILDQIEGQLTYQPAEETRN